MENQVLHKKIELIQWVSTLEDAAIIDKLVAFRESEDSEEHLQISEAQQQSIHKGIKDADAGKVLPHSEVKKMYEQWL